MRTQHRDHSAGTFDERAASHLVGANRLEDKMPGADNTATEPGSWYRQVCEWLLV